MEHRDRGLDSGRSRERSLLFRKSTRCPTLWRSTTGRPIEPSRTRTSEYGSSQTSREPCADRRSIDGCFNRTGVRGWSSGMVNDQMSSDGQGFSKSHTLVKGMKRNTSGNFLHDSFGEMFKLKLFKSLQGFQSHLYPWSGALRLWAQQRG